MGIKQNGICESSLETRNTLEVKDMINLGAWIVAISWAKWKLLWLTSPCHGLILRTWVNHHLSVLWFSDPQYVRVSLAPKGSSMIP